MEIGSKLQVILRKPGTVKKETIIELWIFSFFLLFLIHTQVDYHLLFHTSAELFASIVSFGLFFVAINTSNVSENNFIVLLGIGYFFVGIIDIFHIFTYPGVSIIFERGSQAAFEQLWIAGRYMTALTLLGSTLLTLRNVKKFRANVIFFVYFMACLMILVSILYFRIFPACYVEGGGSTPFKVASELIVSAVYLAVAFLYFKLRKDMDSTLFFFMEAHLLTMAMYELLFASLSGPDGWRNNLAHIIRVVSFFFLYKAFFETGLKRPYAVLYNKMNKMDLELDKTSKHLKKAEHQRKTIEEMLARNDQCYDMIINNSSDAIIIISDSKFIFVNERAANMFGVNNPSDLIDMEVQDYINLKEQERVKELLMQTADELCRDIKFESRLKAQSGNEIDIEVTSAKLLYKGKLSYINIFKDISSRKQINKLENHIKDNERKLIETKEYNKMLTEFFSNISHELKTPLNVILGAIQILSLKGNMQMSLENEDKFNKYLRVMKQNCYRLLRLVNNLIDLSKFDSGYLKLNLCNLNIVSVVEEIILSVAHYVENRGLSIVFDTDIEEKIVAVDADKIERIMLNLLSNSIKFTDTGGSISVNISDREDAVVISVRDTGIGIPKDKLNSIFDRFGQVDKSLTRNKEGSGIGLSLVKTLVELHGGHIGISSVEGEGSEVVFELPVLTVENEMPAVGSVAGKSKVENIKIEFSDIYSFE
ncbi:sensor histidine kinase YycG [Ruminiclostridium hungatei]|uniref:histidine kinase n=1 Tax=Ruminiclostridium hungatei TaxID=48256 RepID=A0A1V4SDV3_RUMHU|nr:MASE3 domain-containing protein [Ruminiclostridium hungatei]OPX42102.1 sensor histidine kinase YycG [Ruminiclostridium hungatei]